jgi:hypothetical protein
LRPARPAGEVAGCEKESQCVVELPLIATFQAREVIEDGSAASNERAAVVREGVQGLVFRSLDAAGPLAGGDHGPGCVLVESVEIVLGFVFEDDAIGI